MLELAVDRPALLERTSTVLCTFEDLFEDLPALPTLREVLLEDRLGVALEELDRAELERAALGREATLELLRLEADELRLVDEGRDAREELEDRLAPLRLLLELLLRELLLRELLLRELLLREPLLRELLLRELLLRELLLREPLLREPLLRELLLELLLLEPLLREPLLLALFAKTGSISRIAVKMAATVVITTCFLHFSVNMVILLSLYFNTPSKCSIRSFYP